LRELGKVQRDREIDQVRQVAGACVLEVLEQMTERGNTKNGLGRMGVEPAFCMAQLIATGCEASCTAQRAPWEKRDSSSRRPHTEARSASLLPQGRCGAA
jgi:hypothetical protein